MTKIQFNASTTNQKIFTNDNLRDKITILYFYPKNYTPGCTLESKDFAHNYENFKSLNVDIYGISLDSMESHEKFKKELNLPFELIFDNNYELCNFYKVLKKKEVENKIVNRIERSTFIIDNENIVYEWRDVKVNNHSIEVLKILENYIKTKNEK